MAEFDDIGVTAAMLELVASAEASSSSCDVRSAQTQDINSNHLLAQAKQVSHGQPQQQVDVLRQRIATLSDSIQIAAARERTERRQHIRHQLKSTEKKLDILWKQNFHVGDKVLVKCKGDRNLPVRDAIITGITTTAFQVILTSNASAENKVRAQLSIERRRSSNDRYLRIISGVPPSKTTAKERNRLGSAYALLMADKMPGMSVCALVCTSAITYTRVCMHAITHARVCMHAITHALVCTSAITHARVCMDAITRTPVCTSAITRALVCTSAITHTPV